MSCRAGNRLDGRGLDAALPALLTTGFAVRW